MAFVAVLVQLLLADPPDVRNVVRVGCRGSPGRVIVPFVQAQVLRRGVRRLGPIDHDRLNRRAKQLRVMDVGPGDHDAQRATVGLDDQTSLGAVLAPICGVTTDVAPQKRALPIAPSALCHCQSTPSSSSQSSTSLAQIAGSTPSRTQR